jgi:hypothetical protein
MMAQDQRTTPAEADLGELRAQIERTRAELGETIEALAARADVKGRAKQALRSRAGALRGRTRRAVRDGAGTLRDSAARAKRPATVGGGAALGALCGWAIYELLRRRW